MVYSAVREREPSRAKRPQQRAEALVATRAVVSLDDRRYVLDGPRATIGRSKEVECVLRDPNVSRRHAELRRAASGDWTIVDLGSTNGSRSTAGGSPRPGSAPATRSRSGRRPSCSTSSSKPTVDGLRPDLSRPQVRLPGRPLPVPALDRALGAQGPAPHGRPGARRDRLPPRARPSRAAPAGGDAWLVAERGGGLDQGERFDLIGGLSIGRSPRRRRPDRRPLRLRHPRADLQPRRAHLRRGHELDQRHPAQRRRR